MDTLFLDNERPETRSAGRSGEFGDAAPERDQGARPSRYATVMRWFLMANFAVIVAMFVLVTAETHVWVPTPATSVDASR